MARLASVAAGAWARITESRQLMTQPIQPTQPTPTVSQPNKFQILCFPHVGPLFLDGEFWSWQIDENAKFLKSLPKIWKGLQ